MSEEEDLKFLENHGEVITQLCVQLVPATNKVTYRVKLMKASGWTREVSECTTLEGAYELLINRLSNAVYYACNKIEEMKKKQEK